jgi:hypothetical protein
MRTLHRCSICPDLVIFPVHRVSAVLSHTPTTIEAKMLVAAVKETIGDLKSEGYYGDLFLLMSDRCCGVKVGGTRPS